VLRNHRRHPDDGIGSAIDKPGLSYRQEFSYATDPGTEILIHAYVLYSCGGRRGRDFSKPPVEPNPARTEGAFMIGNEVLLSPTICGSDVYEEKDVLVDE
jgi:hypothetical protein